jgi:hypothetical protein
VKQCDSYSTSMQVQCCYVEGHSGEHFFSHHDESDRIRWKLAADQRDALQTRLSALEAENERLIKQHHDECQHRVMTVARLEAENERLRADAAATRKRPRLRRIPSLRTQLDTALSDLARVREECELVREAMRQAQQTATRRLDECDRMRPSDEIFETGRWYACTGCHESDEGHPTGTYNAALRCHVGGGCFECGGIGARWEQFDEDALTPKEPLAMLTADTITDEEIRGLRATPDYVNVRPANDERAKRLYLRGLHLVCDDALDSDDPKLRRRARLRCAEILNARTTKEP